MTSTYWKSPLTMNNNSQLIDNNLLVKNYQKTEGFMMAQNFGELISNLSCHKYSFEKSTNYYFFFTNKVLMYIVILFINIKIYFRFPTVAFHVVNDN